MSERTFDNFDEHAFHYRKIHTQNVKLSGADSFYFARHKVSLLAGYEADAPLRLLDVGCGDGAVEVYLKKQFPGFSIDAVDVSEKSIEMARRLSLQQVRFSVFDGTSLPFENEQFDIVLLASVLHHVDFSLHRKLLGEISRVMKKEGRIYVFEHNPLNPFTRYMVRTCEFDKDARLLRTGYARRQLRDSGFRDIAVRFVLFFPRFRWLRPFLSLERFLSRVPLGAQYMMRALKR